MTTVARERAAAYRMACEASASPMPRASYLPPASRSLPLTERSPLVRVVCGPGPCRSVGPLPVRSVCPASGMCAGGDKIGPTGAKKFGDMLPTKGRAK